MACLALPAAAADNGFDPLAEAEYASGTDRAARRAAACLALAQSAWPLTSSDRRHLIQRLDQARAACRNNPQLLALLGSLWLEEGQPSLALVWLERALMLAPELDAARLDHALALAALGDDTARRELRQAWGNRTDVPRAAFDRLHGAVPPVAAAASPPTAQSPWARAFEVAFIGGWESNLDRSPKLTELTITPPDGPITLPLERPLRPRAGLATLLELNQRLAYSSRADTLVQVGAQGIARFAPEERATDWRALQLAASATRRLGPWTWQASTSMHRFDGSTEEPYRAARLSLQVERRDVACGHRLLVDLERKAHDTQAMHDGTATGVGWASSCPLDQRAGWTGAVALRASLDRPRHDGRPGGDQRHLSAGLKLAGSPAPGWGLQTTLRWSRLEDAEGYSPLLANDSPRRNRLWQFGAELTRQVGDSGTFRSEWLLMLQFARQRSNLNFFDYQAGSAFSGMRWSW